MTAADYKTVLILGGPTASGKSGLALSVAKEKGGCVINADSMQVYDGLPILTAQPDQHDKAQAPHRLYAVLSPGAGCDAALWRTLALREIEAAIQENLLPIVVGGTGFYLKALLQGLSPMPSVPREVRDKMSARQRELGNPAFHAELAQKDPETAVLLDPMNTQRVVRAREVLEATGRGLAYWQSLPPESPPPHLRFVVATLLPPREVLYEQCDRRFDAMLAQGALEEAGDFQGRVLAGDVPTTAPLCKALGYPELSAHIRGECNIEEARLRAIKSTRHYAKRQTTWFRHQVSADAVLACADTGVVLRMLSP